MIAAGIAVKDRSQIGNFRFKATKGPDSTN
jgi:hypothetical protein